ncbi:MAG: DEAD/DEAH box helicase [Alphaproteobacteria bacterium]|nr:DEAD/DEAH box helicase [Alphaproteobacteria bacterium]
MPALIFMRDDVRKRFGWKTFEKGEEYQRRGAVRSVEIEAAGARLRGEVAGSGAMPYAVKATVNPIAGDVPSITSECTCPVRFQCKHGAALALAALECDVAGQETDPSVALSPALAGWIRDLASAARRPAEPIEAPAEMIAYVLALVPAGLGRRLSIAPQVVRRLKSGGTGAPRALEMRRLAEADAPYVASEDREISRLATREAGGWSNDLPGAPETVDAIMEMILRTGRSYWEAVAGEPLKLGPARPGSLAWHDAEGRGLAPSVAAAEGLIGLPSAAPWYVDPVAREAGRLEFKQPPEVVQAFLDAPAVRSAEAPLLSALLQAELPDLDLPPPGIAVAEILDAPPTVVLRLGRSAPRPGLPPGWRDQDEPEARRFAVLAFDYGGLLAGQRDALVREAGASGRLVLHRRRTEDERAAASRLQGIGLQRRFTAPRPGGPDELHFFDSRDSPEMWARLLHEEVPALRAEGWRVEIGPDFDLGVVDGSAPWDAAVADQGTGWWFSLDLGVVVDGQRVALLPILLDAIKQLDPATTADGPTHVYAKLPDGRMLALPARRVRALAATLVELFDPGALAPDGTLPVSLGQAMALEGAAAAFDLPWAMPSRLAALAEALRSVGAIAPAEPPAGFGAELRPYQKLGLAWLQVLAAHRLGGVLADDMGLGKTVQTLAHILAEKAAGRLDRPALVVCPTSVVPNWRDEAARFAPGLKVLILHGADRGARFAEIARSDLVITTYALLPRDAEALQGIAWHVAVLDEAQNIKNPKTKASETVRALDARHRVCLTGTPIENHLGELWSQFAFAMPGILGDQARFGRSFRTPIEKQGDVQRTRLLASRLRPFVLRRTKAQVEADLPLKTEIVQRIALDGDQRDLYETVRLAMHKKVRDAVAAKGFDRSRIVILDALLKLRQTCCDPRLVKLAVAAQARSSVKLEHLMETLPPLLEEGRRVLLFSQFTSMLALIEEALQQAGIPFLLLTGDTPDRATPVRRFQAGEVQLFLVSLKAGGTGLNLTAADTVIHYDPWWNPAVEQQATDRAHRIGQDKPVFVYKLIAEGTIEERMLDLQARKRELAEGIFDPERSGAPMFAAEDIETLFQPLPG